MKPRRRFMLAVWLAIQLLLGQELALAHGVGHLDERLRGLSAQLATAADGDEEGGAAHSLARVCPTCIACIGFDALPAGRMRALAAAVSWADAFAVAVLPAPTLAFLAAFRSRAPPPL